MSVHNVRMRNAFYIKHDSNNLMPFWLCGRVNLRDSFFCTWSISFDDGRTVLCLVLTLNSVAFESCVNRSYPWKYPVWKTFSLHCLLIHNVISVFIDPKQFSTAKLFLILTTHLDYTTLHCCLSLCANVLYSTLQCKRMLTVRCVRINRTPSLLVAFVLNEFVDFQ